VIQNTPIRLILHIKQQTFNEIKKIIAELSTVAVKCSGCGPISTFRLRCIRWLCHSGQTFRRYWDATEFSV